MAYQSTTVPVLTCRARDEIALGVRIALADFVRGDLRRRFECAEAGVDRPTIIQQFGLSFAQAAASNRLCRAVPASLVQWAAHVEYNATTDGYPAALPRSVGTFNRQVLTVLPRDTIFVRIGGINLVGQSESLINVTEVVEVRVVAGAEGYFVEIITGRDDDSGRLDTLLPLDGETEDA
jgi:hypothetical protein